MKRGGEGFGMEHDRVIGNASAGGGTDECDGGSEGVVDFGLRAKSMDYATNEGRIDLQARRRYAISTAPMNVME
ncbi:hypothetical protein U1Q18_028042, partial [Sarracenia purpurea var. burkii]